MAITRREERALLSTEELGLVAQTHHPEIAQVEPAELRALAHRLRERHDRLRDLIRAQRRAKRGKAEPRSGANTEQMTRRKQVFAAALKRVNTRFARSA